MRSSQPGPSGASGAFLVFVKLKILVKTVAAGPRPDTLYFNLKVQAPKTIRGWSESY